MYFLQWLADYDVYSISFNVYRKLQKYVSQEWFTPERIKRVNVGAANLAKWVIGANKCYEIINHIGDANNLSPLEKSATVANLNGSTLAAENELPAKKMKAQKSYLQMT